MMPLRRIAHEKRRIVVPIGIVLAANVVVLAAAVLPLSAKVDTAAIRASRAGEALGLAKGQYEAAEALVSGKARADEELRRFYEEVLPEDGTAARRISYVRLVQLARTHRLRLTRASSEAPTTSDSALTQIQLTMQLTGDYRSVRQFIYELESAPEFVVIENVALAQGTEASAPLMLTIDVSTYYRAKETDE